MTTGWDESDVVAAEREDPWPEAAAAMAEINARPPVEPDESEPPF